MDRELDYAQVSVSVGTKTNQQRGTRQLCNQREFPW